MKNEKQMIRWLYFLRFIAIFNVFIFAFFLFNDFKYWKIYFLINATLIVGYIWYNYFRLFLIRVKKKKYEPLKNMEYTIVVPCYNEERHLLIQTVESILKTDNIKKEIIIVDDGSKNGIWETIKELQKKSDQIKIFKFDQNKGKRFAHKLAIEQSTKDFIVSIDSDTIIAKNAIVKLLEPFSDPNIGATTGNILIKNEKKNILTRMQAGLYWVGLNIYKNGQSSQGNVVCCSGCLSAYRKKDLLIVLDEYINQTFLGNKCHASEDRYLTNLINEMGKNVVYVDDSICYTEAPEKLSKFVKQQIRWKRGFYRESLYTSTYAWKKSKPLYFETVVWQLITPILYLSMVLTTVFLFIFHPIYSLITLLPMIVLFIVCRDSLFFIENPKRALFYVPYMFLYLFVLYPLNIYAIFNSNPEKWGTR